MAFLFYVTIILIFLYTITVTAKLRIEIVNLKYIKKSPKNFFGVKYEAQRKFEFIIKIRIYIFGKIPITSIKINENNLKKYENKKILKIIRKKFDLFQIKIIEDINNRDKKIFKDILNIVRKTDVKIKGIDMVIDIGIDDVIATSIVVPVISTGIAFILQNVKFNNKKGQYLVKPIYNLEGLKSSVNLSIKCILEFKFFMKKIPKKLLTFRKV